jgi:hypothetical protein
MTKGTFGWEHFEDGAAHATPVASATPTDIL